VERLTIDQIPHNARFEGKRNKGRPRLRWIDNVKEDIESIGLTLRDISTDISTIRLNDETSGIRVEPK